MARRSAKEKTDSSQLLYAIVMTDQALDFGNVGLDNRRVTSVNHKDIAALVSSYPQVSSIKLLHKNLAPYHRVVRDAAKRFSTIPARFGQVAKDTAEIQLALRRNYAALHHELLRFEGKNEMGLSVWWNVNDVFQQWLLHDAELKSYRDRLLARKGKLSRNDQIDFGHHFLARIEQLRADISKKILAALPSVEARVGTANDDKTIANISLLIDRNQQAALESSVDKLGATMGEEYGIRLDGPWPPFSFVDRLDLKW